MAYAVELTKRAEKQLASLDRKTLLLVAAAIDEIAESDNPHMLPNAKKLQGVSDGFRWRVGTYRLLGTVDDGKVVVELFRIGHRREVYRNL